MARRHTGLTELEKKASETQQAQQETVQQKPKSTRKGNTKNQIPPEKYFYLCDGRQLKNCKELAKALKTMGDQVFCHHVNEQKNDFANWIGDVFNEKEIAEKIYGARDRLEIRKMLYAHFMKKHR